MNIPAKKPAKRITVLLEREVEDLLNTYNSYLPQGCALNLTWQVNVLLKAHLQAKLAEHDQE